MTNPLTARVTSDPRIMMGKPVIKGTRIPVELILRQLAAGDSEQQILADHPRLTIIDIHAAQAFAADYLDGEEINGLRGHIPFRVPEASYLTHSA